MIKFLRGLGMTSDVAYLAGVLSIGASIAAWTASTRMEDAPGDKADRWGIYRRPVGLYLYGSGQRHQDGRRQLSVVGSTRVMPLPRPRRACSRPGPDLTFTRRAPVPDAAPGNYRRGGTRGQHWSP
jgi:hypothetical protein